MDTFAVADSFYIHLTVSDAGPAPHTLIKVNFYPDQGELVEHAVYGSEGTDKSAESPVTEHAQSSDEDHYDKFTCKINTEHSEV